MSFGPRMSRLANNTYPSVDRSFKKMDRNVSVEDEEEWVLVPRNSLVEKMEYMQQ